MKQLTKDELLALMDEETHEQIKKLLRRPDAYGMIVFECLDLSSSNVGHRTALIFGPGCTIKTLADCPPWLHDLPSQREYPVGYYPKAGCG